MITPTVRTELFIIFTTCAAGVDHDIDLSCFLRPQWQLRNKKKRRRERERKRQKKVFIFIFLKESLGLKGLC